MSNKLQADGVQRLSLRQLREWEALGLGMFVHFGMSTFDGEELSKGDKPSTFYRPDKLDVGQWISIARDTGMKYAVLTAKHVSGHSLWPTQQNDYHVGTSGNRTDVVAAFVRACEKRGVMPGLYYCSWDNRNRFGSITPSMTKGPTWGDAFTTAAYREFQWRQLEELLTQYGPIGEVWIDIPGVLPRDYRQALYEQIVRWQPEAVIVMNNCIGDGTKLNVGATWPTDVITIERFLPNSHTRHEPWREVEGQRYYLPGEVCDPIGKDWFYVKGDQVRSDAELLGMYLVTRSRGANLLLDVGPDRHGLIPRQCRDSLRRLRRNLDRLHL